MKCYIVYRVQSTCSCRAGMRLVISGLEQAAAAAAATGDGDVYHCICSGMRRDRAGDTGQEAGE